MPLPVAILLHRPQKALKMSQKAFEWKRTRLLPLLNVLLQDSFLLGFLQRLAKSSF